MLSFVSQCTVLADEVTREVVHGALPVTRGSARISLRGRAPITTTSAFVRGRGRQLCGEVMHCVLNMFALGGCKGGGRRKKRKSGQGMCPLSVSYPSGDYVAMSELL